MVYHTPPGRLSLADISTGGNSAGAKEVGARNISPTAFRRPYRSVF